MLVSRHSRTHSRPHGCKLCGKAFAWKNELDRHSTHHQAVVVRYPCSVPGCDSKRFSRKDNLRKHIRKYHGTVISTDDDSQQDEITRFCNEAHLEQKNLMESSSLLLAAEAGNELMLRFLIDRGADITVRSQEGQTVLHVAARKGNLKCVRALLDLGVSVEEVDVHGNSALHGAACSGEAAIVEIILSKGAARRTCNHVGYTALHFSVQEGHIAVAKVLLKHGFEISLPTRRGKTPLHLAIRSRQMEMIELLLENGADLEACSTYIDMPIRYAIRSDRKKSIQDDESESRANDDVVGSITRLLLEYGANPDDGMYALYLLREYHEPIIRLLLEHGAKGYLNLVLEGAAKLRKESIVRLLIKHGANRNCAWFTHVVKEFIGSLNIC